MWKEYELMLLEVTKGCYLKGACFGLLRLLARYKLRFRSRETMP